MAINPYYPGGINFSPYSVGQSYIPQQAQQTTNIVNMVLVNSEDEARNYQLNPGSSIFLMDSNNQLFYTKSVDFSGIATFKKYQFHEVTDPPAQPQADYITREEFEEWKKQQYRKPQYQKKEREQQ